MRRSGRATAPGFSLIEAVAALALLALALPPIAVLLSGAISRTVRGNDRDAALVRAESLIADERTAFRGRFGVRDGSDPAGRWTVETAPLPDTGPEPGAKPVLIPARLKVTVQPDSGSAVTLETLILYGGARR